MKYILPLLLFIALIPTTTSHAQGALAIEDRGVTLEFPDRAHFAVQAQSDVPISQIVLEYGTDQLTCGTVVSKAFPVFTPATTVDTTWTWEMRQSGSEPPGAQIWYRWRVTDEAGKSQLSEITYVTWIDDTHPWQQMNNDRVTLHWYDGDRAFATELFDAATAALDHLGTTAKLVNDAPVQLYIYGSTDDMREAVLFEPGWTGGLAYSEHGITIIGINTDILDWGKDTIAHELTHLLVGRIAFSCIGNIPTWLNEGIAVYGEGGPDPSSAAALQVAIAENTIPSLRSLSGGFSEHPDKADLSYSQSYSVVNYLIGTFGAQKLLDLFDLLSDGTQPDPALQQVYGFGVDGLEDRWRESVGAAARVGNDAVPTPTLQPSPVPTYQPIAAVPVAPTRAPTAVGGNTTTAAPAASDTGGADAVGLDLRLLLIGVAVLLGLAVLGFGAWQLLGKKERL